jgi:hypothetical protein
VDLELQSGTGTETEFVVITVIMQANVTVLMALRQGSHGVTPRLSVD